MKRSWSVAVVYEDTIARGEAQAFCDRLVEVLWREQGLDIKWLSFDSLADEREASDAAAKAAEADVLILANRPHSPELMQIRDWAEEWLRCRGIREGLLVGLSEPLRDSTPTSCANYAFLRELAHRAGMDYMNEVPQNLGWVMPESPDGYSHRADQTSSTLSAILRPPKAPPLM